MSNFRSRSRQSHLHAHGAANRGRHIAVAFHVAGGRAPAAPRHGQLSGGSESDDRRLRKTGQRHGVDVGRLPTIVSSSRSRRRR